MSDHAETIAAPRDARGNPRSCRVDVEPAGGPCRVMLDVLGSIAVHRDLQSLVRDLVDVLRRVVRFDRLGVVLHDPQRDVMRLHTLAAAHTPVTTNLELPIAESPAARLRAPKNPGTRSREHGTRTSWLRFWALVRTR
jgi:hypothetical protein